MEVNFLEKVIHKYSNEGSKEILDLGCGTGIHDKNLTEKGHNILGLDLSKDMIEIAKSKDIPNANFIVGNMANFELGKKFDVCISMFAAFGYLIENKEIKSSIKSIKKHLNKGGLFIFEVWNGLAVMNELPSSRENEEISENYKIIRKSYPKLNSFKQYCEVKFNVKILENNSLINEYEETHNMRFFFPQEIKKYLEDENFEVLEICNAFELGSKIDENNWNMVVIAKSN
jgi:SAM-dependent methyltransferase